ncbi:GcrA family cell cycle regulator [Pararhizobium sp. IMCC21322]|uniref:GcrA family cell cycle regulator n=1 Tax=Pararhizobium sp. IMCC21322 TaxID=3067903 RepID=UPI0027411A13|nr:GcrA family cell cycle regulator [Pararhizobium sp. IMCC21322]
MSWTEERVALLSKLWADGLSASQIATQLGGVTRNAVIGKVHRLGLSGRAKSASTAARPRKPRASTASKTSIKSDSASSAPRRPQTMGATALKFEADVEAEAAIAPQAHDDVVVPISKRASILTITEQTCKWPIGDPGGNDFHFCGHDSKEGAPYCNYHCKVAYQPASDRRRKAS